MTLQHWLELSKSQFICRPVAIIAPQRSIFELKPKHSSPCVERGRLAIGDGAACALIAARRSANGNRGKRTVCLPPRPSAPLRMNAPPSESADEEPSPRINVADAALRDPVPMPPSDENTRGGAGAGTGCDCFGGGKRATFGCAICGSARDEEARATDSAAAARASAAAARASAAPADATARASSSRTLAVSAWLRATARLRARTTSSLETPVPSVCRSTETAAAYTASASAAAEQGPPSPPDTVPPSERSKDSILAAVVARISAACASARARRAASRSAASKVRSASRSRTKAALARAASAAAAAAAPASASASASSAEAEACSSGPRSTAQHPAAGNGGVIMLRCESMFGKSSRAPALAGGRWVSSCVASSPVAGKSRRNRSSAPAENSV